MNQELKHKERKAPKKTDREKEKARVAKFHKGFSQAESSVSGKQKQWKIIDLFDRSKQWDNIDLPPWIPRPVQNMIRYIRILKRANLAANIPAAHFTAINVKFKDEVGRLQKAYKHVWSTEKVPLMVRRCIDRTLLQGTAIGFVYSEDEFVGGEYYGEDDPNNQLFQGRIRVKRFPIMNFFPDPDAFSLEDCRWIETTETTTLELIKKNPKFKEYAGDKLLDLNVSSGKSDSESGQIFDRDNNSMVNDQADEKDDRVVLHTHWELELDDSGMQKLNVFYYLQNTDFLLYEDLDVKPGIFPFAVLYDEEEEQDFFGSATADGILEKQKLINKTEQAASIIGTMNQNPQKVIARESGINGQDMSRTGNMPGKVWVSNIDPSRSVYTIAPVDIPRGLFDLKDRAVSDIREEAGINEAYSGDSVGSLTTSTGVTSLIERSTLRDKDKMLQIDDFVCQLSNIIVMFILEKWKEERPMIDVGPAGKVEQDTWIPFGDDMDIRNLSWFVRSDVYASAPTTQALKRQQADNLLQIQEQFKADPPIITLEEWLNVQDFDNKDEILARMTMDKEMKKMREATDFAQIAIQLAEEGRQMIAMGEPKEKVNEMLKGKAQELLDMNAKKAAEIGFNDSSSGRPRDAEAPNGRPPASMSPQANQNMVRG